MAGSLSLQTLGLLPREYTWLCTLAIAADEGQAVDEANGNIDNKENQVRTRTGMLFNLPWLMILNW